MLKMNVANKEYEKIKQMFMDYVKLYNNSDYKKAVNQYYTEDSVFEAPQDKLVGRESILKFFNAIHPEGIKTLMHLQNIVIDGDRLAAEFDVECIFSVDKPDYFLGPVKMGEIYIIRLGVFYTLRDGKITKVRLYEFGKLYLKNKK